MPSSPPSSELRERLLASTTAIIREHGLAFVSLRAVARRSRVSHGAPAYHFRNKSGLLTAYAAEGYRKLVAEVKREMARVEGEGREKLLATGIAYVRFALENPEHFSIMFRGELHERQDRELLEASNEAIGILSDVLKGCVTRGQLPAERLPVTIATAWSLAHGIATLWLHGRLPARLAASGGMALAEDVLGGWTSLLLPEPPARSKSQKKPPARR